MHASLEALSPHQARLRARCQELHPTWRFMFWNDTALEEYVRLAYPWYHGTWMGIEPLIKRIDTSRYMLMHGYGGVYLDADVECVAPLDSLVDPLPRHAAWVGDFPEPMFLASAPKNEFWLHALDRISRVWSQLNAWQSTGPSGLNTALVEWVARHGSGALVPFVTQRPEPEFREFVKRKNNTVPWFELSDRNWRLDGPPGAQLPEVWISPTGRGKDAAVPQGGLPLSLPAFNYSSPAEVPPSRRVGFLANELLDPAGCNAGELELCRSAWCKVRWPLSYVVHHCLNTWRGRIGDAR